MIQKDKRAWAWVPVLYFTQGLPYIIVIGLSTIMYKRLGISNADIGLYTSLLGLPWVLKPLWSPFVDIKSTKRNWFLIMQLVVVATLLGVGFTVQTNSFLVLTLAFFLMTAIASATNDIATDGYYMIGLSEKKQSFFVGIRSTAYRLAVITGSGLIVVVAGYLEKYYGDNSKAWSVTIIITALLMLLLTFYNFLITPKYESSAEVKKDKPNSFIEVFISFFKKSNIGITIAFILSFRLGESQLGKMVKPFMLDPQAEGGLDLSTELVGIIDGTVGIIMLVIGGILGGILISRDGLKKWLLPMMLILNIPNIFYALLAFTKSTSIIAITGVVVIEQLGYGFGFTAFLIYLLYVAEGNSKTSHYAIATGFMALGAMFAGAISGFVQEQLGYSYFFVWVVIAAIPSFILLRYIEFPADFGKKINVTNE